MKVQEMLRNYLTALSDEPSGVMVDDYIKAISGCVDRLRRYIDTHD